MDAGAGDGAGGAPGIRRGSAAGFISGSSGRRGTNNPKSAFGFAAGGAFGAGGSGAPSSLFGSLPGSGARPASAAGFVRLGDEAGGSGGPFCAGAGVAAAGEFADIGATGREPGGSSAMIWRIDARISSIDGSPARSTFCIVPSFQPLDALPALSLVS